MLEGIRVVEIGQNIAGPFAATILADLGAEVIKVEKPEGDDARGWLVRTESGPVPLAFHVMNHAKKSVVVDFKNRAERDRFVDFLGDVDVLVHNLRPGLAEEMGIDGPTLRKRWPRLVYCEIGAFGHTGPLRLKPGYEPLAHAFSGIMALTGEPEGRPMRAGVSIIDPGTGMWGAIGILAALRQRDRTGAGCIVNASLFETGLLWCFQQAAGYMLTGREPERQGNGNATLTPYQVFDTMTEPVMIAAGNDRLYGKLCAVLGRMDLARDPRFARVADRVANKAELIPLLEPEILKRRADELCEALDAVGVPNSPINKVSAAIDHPQTAALDIIQAEPVTGLRMVGLPISFDGQRPRVRARTPELGEHTAAVLGAPVK